jgi:hypothetical protein
VKLEEARQVIELAEAQLAGAPFVVAHTFERNGRRLSVAITDRLRRSCKKGRVWKSKAMLTAFKNAEYGFDLHHAHSPGGNDGIFLLTREHRPRNEMMRKIFDQFLDKPGAGSEAIAEALAAAMGDLKAVRLVSHHLRLLGLLRISDDGDSLVLVDYDDTK